MRQIVTLVFLFFLLTNSFGQKKFGNKQSKYAIKVYQNTDKFKAVYHNWYPSDNIEVNYVNFNRFSIAFDFNTDKNLTHEIELLIPEVSKPIYNVKFPMNYDFLNSPAAQRTISTYSLRYEFNKTFYNRSKQVAINLGVGINPYYVRAAYIPGLPDTYNAYTTYYGATINIVPRIKYQLSKQFALDLNIPLKIYDLREEVFYISNPAIPPPQQKTYKTHNIFFENTYTIRLGLCYNFN